MTQACAICSSVMAPLFVRQILSRYDVQYFHCQDCGYARTEKPYWLAEAYSDAIAIADTGVLQRNHGLAARLAATLYFCMEPRSAYLDIAGGYGILTRLMRDYGFDYYWEDAYCANVVARGFEATRATSPFAALSGFEVIEHTVDPLAFVAGNMERHRCRNFIFSTETYTGTRPPADWWYFTPMTGQHISFFHERTLQRIAQRLGLTFHSNGGLHFFTDGTLRNTALLPILNSTMAYPIARVVRKVLGSKTWADHLSATAPAAESGTRTFPGSTNS